MANRTADLLGEHTVRKALSMTSVAGPKTLLRVFIACAFVIVSSTVYLRLKSSEITPERRGDFGSSGLERVQARPLTAKSAPDFLFEMKGTAPYGRVTYPGAMVSASDGTIYVADIEDHRVVRFDRDGNVLSAWGAYGSADGQLIAPIDVAVAPDGTVYVSDSGNSRIQRFTSDGKHLATWGSNGGDESEFRGWNRGRDQQTLGPGSIAVDASGLVIVDDPAAQRVQVFTPAGTFIRDWKYPIVGARESVTREIVAMRMGPDNTLVVLMSSHLEDRRTIRLLRKYDSFGRGLAEWDITEDVRDADGLAVATDGSIYVAQYRESPPVVRYSVEGSLIDSWVMPEELGVGSPEGIAVSPDGTVFVGDVERRRVMRFDEHGVFELGWTDGPPSPGQEWPRAVAAAPSGSCT